MDLGELRDWTLPGPPALRYTARQVAAWLDISTDTLRRLIDQGRFPRGHKLGQGEPTWTGLDIAAWLHLRDRMYPADDEAQPDATDGNGTQPDAPRRK